MSASVPLAMTTLYPGALDRRDRTPDNRLMLGKDAKMELICHDPLILSRLVHMLRRNSTLKKREALCPEERAGSGGPGP